MVSFLCKHHQVSLLPVCKAHPYQARAAAQAVHSQSQLATKEVEPLSSSLWAHGFALLNDGLAHSLSGFKQSGGNTID